MGEGAAGDGVGADPQQSTSDVLTISDPSRMNRFVIRLRLGTSNRHDICALMGKAAGVMSATPGGIPSTTGRTPSATIVPQHRALRRWRFLAVNGGASRRSHTPCGSGDTVRPSLHGAHQFRTSRVA